MAIFKVWDGSTWVEVPLEDPTLYLLLDGTRAMTGDLDMGANAITNVGNVDGVDVSGHASRHTDGSDDIQDATGLQKGLMTAAQGNKLGFIESNADVTDATNVDAAGAVMESDIDAKGDLFVGTADNAVTRVAVGSNTKILTADSGEASGTKWDVPGERHVSLLAISTAVAF